MYLSQKHISRRTVLKGVGASIALPLLDAMNPAATAWALTAAGSTPKRLAFVGFPHGAIMDRWSPRQTGADYEMSTILEPLTPFRQHLTIVSGLRNKPGETPEPHGYIESTWLSCVKPWDHGVLGPQAGVTADQMAARHIGQDTRLPSLELTTAQVGARLAWRTPTQPLPQEGNPRAVFQKLFGQGDTDKERAAILSETGSILDRVKGQAARLQASLGVRDRVVVSDYLDSVREIERRVQMAAQQDASSLDIPDAPVGTPNDISEHFKLMFDLMALACVRQRSEQREGAPKMADRLFVRRQLRGTPASPLVVRDRFRCEPRLIVVPRDYLGLGRDAFGEAFLQYFGDARVQSLARALE
jgi:hypothetical protein